MVHLFYFPKPEQTYRQENVADVHVACVKVPVYRDEYTHLHPCTRSDLLLDRTMWLKQQRSHHMFSHTHVTHLSTASLLDQQKIHTLSCHEACVCDADYGKAIQVKTSHSYLAYSRFAIILMFNTDMRNVLFI